MKLKPHTTYEQQVQLLKDKGFIITPQDEPYVLDFLKTTNYYCFSAYLLPYKTSSSPDKYKQGINISLPMLAYTFDRQLSSILYEAIGVIESYLRTLFAYELALKYGPECYYNRTLFKTTMTDEEFDSYCQKIKEAIKRNSQTPVVKHHNDKYAGKLPFWVVIDFFSLGMMSNLYKHLTSKNQKLLNRQGLKIGTKHMQSWLKCLTDLRNRIAHYSRLYHWRFLSTPADPINTQYKMDDTLFSQIYMLKHLCPDMEYWNVHILGQLKDLMDLYSDTDIIKHIKFPPNWEELLTN